MYIREGDIFGYRWKWNETIRPLSERPGRPGTWGYANTDGIGLVEYLQVGIPSLQIDSQYVNIMSVV